MSPVETRDLASLHAGLGTHLALIIVLAEVALAVAIVAIAAWDDRSSRPTGPESPVVAYSAAVGRRDLAGALDQLLPEIREQAAPFVAWQLGNRYTILESAVRTGSWLDRMAGTDRDHPLVVVTMEIRNHDGGTRWRAVEELPVDLRNDRWYLLKPPLEPPADD